MIESKDLPRLLYIGDVPVESSYHGSALIYRLLQKYPVDKLLIVQGNIWGSTSNQNKLPNVSYKQLFVGFKRLAHSRFSYFYNCYMLLTAKQRTSQLTHLLDTFQPQAILTVAHGFSWLTAAKLANDLKLPLHLIVHDDCVKSITLPQPIQKWVEKQVGKVYRLAQSQFCISPYMVEEYEKRYGVKGSVLYPCRAVDAIEFDQPATRTQEINSSLTFAYAGSIYNKAYAQNLILLARVLESLGHNLMIYSPTTIESLRAFGLNTNNVTVHPFVPSSTLINILRNSADVLFVPMSFEEEHRSNMMIAFPSKLTDCTQVGLPMLIFGPAYCSAVRWAKDNPNVAEVIDQQDVQLLTKAVQNLSQDPEYRFQLATNALIKGHEFFSHAAASYEFYNGLNLKNWKQKNENYF